MKQKRILFGLQAVAGIILLLLGFLVFTANSVKMLSGLCIGLGAAVLVLGIGWLMQSFIVSVAETDAIQKAKNIEVHDERNIRIREKTGYMVAKVMNYLLVLFVLTLGFMGVDKAIIIMAAILVVVEFILVLIFSNYFSKTI